VLVAEGRKADSRAALAKALQACYREDSYHVESIAYEPREKLIMSYAAERDVPHLKELFSNWVDHTDDEATLRNTYSSGYRVISRVYKLCLKGNNGAGATYKKKKFPPGEGAAELAAIDDDATAQKAALEKEVASVQVLPADFWTEFMEKYCLHRLEVLKSKGVEGTPIRVYGQLLSKIPGGKDKMAAVASKSAETNKSGDDTKTAGGENNKKSGGDSKNATGSPSVTLEPSNATVCLGDKVLFRYKLANLSDDLPHHWGLKDSSGTILEEGLFKGGDLKYGLQYTQVAAFGFFPDVQRNEVLYTPPEGGLKQPIRLTIEIQSPNRQETLASAEAAINAQPPTFEVSPPTITVQSGISAHFTVTVHNASSKARLVPIAGDWERWIDLEPEDPVKDGTTMTVQFNATTLPKIMSTSDDERVEFNLITPGETSLGQGGRVLFHIEPRR
jgi:hypothetical protein